MEKQYALIKDEEYTKLKKAESGTKKLLVVFVLIMLCLIVIFYIINIIPLVYIFGFSLIAGLFIFYVYCGGTSEGKWISPEELIDEKEVIEQLDEDDSQVVLKVNK